MRSPSRLLVALILPAIVLCAACGGSSGSQAAGSAASTAGAPSATSTVPSGAAPSASSAGSLTAAAAASAATGSATAVTLRFVNLYTTKQKQPGPALDIYDTLTGQAAKPLLTGLAYGTVSTYVHPSAMGGGLIMLYALPTGEDPVAKASDAKGLNMVQNASLQAQETIRIDGDPTAEDNVPLAGLSFSTILEKGSDNGTKGPPAPLPASGHGEILVDKSAFTVLVPTNQPYLLIDSSCAPPLNGESTLPGVPYIFATDGKAPASSEAVFVTTPGAHQVSVDIDSPTDAPTCAQLTTKQSTSTVTVAAGQQVLAFLYGTSPTDAHLVYAPITS